MKIYLQKGTYTRLDFVHNSTLTNMYAVKNVSPLWGFVRQKIHLDNKDQMVGKRM